MNYKGMYVMLAVCAVLLADCMMVVLLGDHASALAQGELKGCVDKIVTKELIIQDDKGRMQIQLKVEGGAAKILLIDGAGVERVRILANDEQAALEICDQNKDKVAEMFYEKERGSRIGVLSQESDMATWLMAGEKFTSLLATNEEGESRISLGLLNDIPVFALQDATETDRVLISIDRVVGPDIRCFDENGNITWSALLK